MKCIFPWNIPVTHSIFQNFLPKYNYTTLQILPHVLLFSLYVHSSYLSALWMTWEEPCHSNAYQHLVMTCDETETVFKLDAVHNIPIFNFSPFSFLCCCQSSNAWNEVQFAFKLQYASHSSRIIFIFLSCRYEAWCYFHNVFKSKGMKARVFSLWSLKCDNHLELRIKWMHGRVRFSFWWSGEGCGGWGCCIKFKSFGRVRKPICIQNVPLWYSWWYSCALFP